MQCLFVLQKYTKQIKHSNNLLENYPLSLRYITNTYKNTTFNTNIQRFA